MMELNVERPQRGRRGRARPLVLAVLATLALAASACTEMPPPVTNPPTPGIDLTVALAPDVIAVIGSQATYTATVSNVGTQDSAGVVTATVVVPPGQTVATASGTGWACTTASAQATCTANSAVVAGQSLPGISVDATVGGDPYLTNVYGAVAVAGDVNAANDSGRAGVTVVPARNPDQLYVQLSGALNLRAGGNISSGDVSITSDLIGPSALVVTDAQVGTAHVSMNLQREAATLFSGPVTITDPGVQGGDPLTVNWRGALFGRGSRPFRNLTGSQVNLRIPSLDLGGITGALAGGITFSLGITAGDYQPNPPVSEPPLTYANTGVFLAPVITTPDRLVSGATFTLDTGISATSGWTIGPISADIDLPAGLTFVGPASGTTCTDVPAVPGRQRCYLDSSLTSPVAPNLIAAIAGSVLPVSLPSISIRVQPTVAFTPLTVRATLDAGNASPQSTTSTLEAKPPGPDVGITLNGPEKTPNLFFTEGTGLSQNRYDMAVDNVGTATSSSPTVVLNLPAGVSYRGFTTSGLTAPNRFSCSAAAQVVTCTRPNGVATTGLLTPAPSLSVLVDVAAPVTPSVTATATVTNANDVDPGSPAKTASATTNVAAAGAQTFGASLSNGAFSVSGRTVLQGGFTFTTAPNGRLDAIAGCGTSMNYTPPVLAVPIVGPTLVPALFSDNKLCVNISRVLNTNQFVGTVGTDFVAPPVFLPVSVPTVTLPPVIPPRKVGVGAVTTSAPTLNLDGSLSGTSSGVSAEMILNGGATYNIDWNVGPAPGVTCVDVNLCP